jgi:hypothetical protein
MELARRNAAPTPESVAIKTRHQGAALDRRKFDQLCATLCPYRGATRISKETLLHNHFSLIPRPDALFMRDIRTRHD